MQRQFDPCTLALSVMSPKNCALILALGASLLASCSLTTYGDDACSSNGDCRAAFGFGATCGENGLCSGGGMNARCTRTFPRDLFTRPQLYTDSIVFGVIVNESDPAEVANENAIELAVLQVNDFEGANGRPFAAVFCNNAVDSDIDTATEELATAALGRYLSVDLGVPAIVGPPTSSQAESLINAVSSLGTLMISHSATSTALTTLDTEGLFWRTCPPDSEQGVAIADDLMARSVARVAMIYEEGPYGTGLAGVFTNAFSGTTTPFPFNLGNNSMRDAQALAVGGRAAEFDEILFISSDFEDARAFLRFTAADAALNGKQIFLTDTAAGSPAFLTDTLAAPLFPRIRGSRPTRATGTVYSQFRSAYLARFMVPEEEFDRYQYAPYAYDAAWLVFAGAVWSVQARDELRGSSMADGLKRVSSTRTAALRFDLLPGSWDGLSAELTAGRDVNVAGASGTLEFDTTTDETSGPVDVWTIDSISDPPAIVVDRVVAPAR